MVDFNQQTNIMHVWIVEQDSSTQDFEKLRVFNNEYECVEMYYTSE